jgi:hypothetical protein
MWTMPDEMLLILAEHGAGVLLVVDQYPVGALGPDAANEPLRIAVRPGRPGRSLDHVDAVAANTASNDPANLESRSRIRNRKAPVRSPRSITRLRAICVVHPAVGCSVTPRMWTRLVVISITNSTYSRNPSSRPVRTVLARHRRRDMNASSASGDFGAKASVSGRCVGPGPFTCGVAERQRLIGSRRSSTRSREWSCTVDPERVLAVMDAAGENGRSLTRWCATARPPWACWTGGS